MPFLPQAVTAAVAHSAAGRWALPGRAPAGWQPAVPRQAHAWPVLALAEPLRPHAATLTPDRACNLAVDLAADLQSAAPWLTRFAPDRIGVAVTVSKGGIGPWSDATARITRRDGGAGLNGEGPGLLDILPPDAAGGFVAAAGGWCGPRIAPVAACATGVAGLACGARLLITDRLQAVICGGSESSLHPAVLHSMGRMGILDPAPMRPFDCMQAGFNLGEGGALLVLEPIDPDRTVPAGGGVGAGAGPAGYLTGAVLVADGHHITDMHPTRTTLTRVLRRIFAERQAPGGHAAAPLTGLYVNAHGTATALNDAWESEQLIAAFGRDGWARREGWLVAGAEVWISGTKSMTGHLLGASGALEAVLCLQVLQGAPVPPTFRLTAPREPWPAALVACPQLHLPMPGEPPPAAPPPAALSLNYGFGGHVGGVLFERELSHGRA